MRETALRHKATDPQRDLLWSQILFGLALLLTAAALAQLLSSLVHQLRIEGWFAADEVLYLATAGILLFGNVIHQLVRFGLARRVASLSAVATQTLPSADTNEGGPLVTVLVPSYKEEPEVVLRTLLSAALQTYSNRRVVLLLDDPPEPGSPADGERLALLRAMPERITRFLRPLHEWIEHERAAFLTRQGTEPAEVEIARWLGLASAVSVWLDSASQAWSKGDHTERFFSEQVIRRLGRLECERSRHIAQLAAAEPARCATILADEYDRLWGMFQVDLTVFERKRYANLSHAANKAMNLNSYIACLGRHLAERSRGGAPYLVDVTPERAQLAPPASPYLLTLDADSILLPEYTERLIAVMERPGNERLAVLQTPYATFPGAAAPVERVAGATTDVQLLLHQGYSHYRATFWVGANALLRRSALDDIAVTTLEDGLSVTRYVQDRTVIEDTESTLDLVRRGWRLHNHPERLAYSATPPDFGSLIIQRRRWACGGILILPKLLSRARQGTIRSTLSEFLIRFHYLASLAYGPIAVLLMLLYPFENTMDGIWLPLTAIPYFIAYGRDLAALGYRRRDLLGVYALNLLLVPIHFAGFLASLRQAVTGAKVPFRRTPKISGRVGAPASFVLVAWSLPAFCFAGATIDLWLGHMAQAVFAALNGTMFAYAAVVFVGPRASLEDLLDYWRGQHRRLGCRRQHRAMAHAPN